MIEGNQAALRHLTSTSAPDVESHCCSAEAERDERIARLRSQLACAAGGDHNVLAAVHHVSARGRVAPGRKRVFPEKLAGLLVEGVDALVPGAGNEHQSAGGHDRAAERLRCRFAEYRGR